MKKLLFLVGIMLTMLVASCKPVSAQDLSFTPQFGYSTMNGMVGVEVQVKNIAVSIGYFAHQTPESFSDLSRSLALTWYGGGVYESGFYGSLGFATKDYLIGDFYGNHENISEMYMVMGGMRALIHKRLNFKVGIGYAYSENRHGAMGEATVGYMISWY